MLVICNGAIKSGSTWLFNVLKVLTNSQDPPKNYLTQRSEKSPCIRPELLASYLATEDYRTRNFISKNHLNRVEHRDLLAKYDDVYVFDIERDPKDVIVSNYYHDRFRNGYQGSFADYYWEQGREVAGTLADYHNLWRGDHPRFYISSYEKLHQEFAGEVRRIAAVLGVLIADEELETVRERTSIKNLREDYREDPRYAGEKFFRKGEVGDWRNHFDTEMLNDIVRIERDGIRWYDWTRARNRLASLFGRKTAPPTRIGAD